jgi:hypothetical protein
MPLYTTSQLRTALLMVDGRADQGGVLELPPGARLLLDVLVEGSEDGALLDEIADAVVEAKAARDEAALIAGLTGEDGAVAALLGNPASATSLAASATIAAAFPTVRVNPDGTGDYLTLAAALADFPAGNVNIDLVGGTHAHAVTHAASGQKNVTIRGMGWQATRLDCAQGFIQARTSSDQWTIRDLWINSTATTNTYDAIDVDYPRRWDVVGCRISGFGGASVRYRGGIHSWVRRCYFIAQDSTDANGLAAIYVEKSLAAVVATTIRTEANYVGAGKQYGIYADSAKQSVFDSDIVEGCDVGMRFVSLSGELRQPYTEANTAAIQIHDSNGLVVLGDLRDQPVWTWAGVASADRRPVRLGRYFNPGKGIIYPGASGVSQDPDASPSIRWGTGSPEGAVTAVKGSEWNRTDGAVGTTKYVKESGTGNTGWTAVAGLPTYGTPTIAAASANGTTPPAPTVASGSTDQRGQAVFGSGATPSAGSQVTVTFATPRSSAEYFVTLTGGNSGTPSRQPYVANKTVNGFDIGFGTAPTASQGATVYRVEYVVA